MCLLWVPRPGVGGQGLCSGVCWGSGAVAILSLPSPQPAEGLSPARLLGFCCCTALLLGKVNKNNLVNFFTFLPDLPAPSCKGSRRHSGEGEQEESK